MRQRLLPYFTLAIFTLFIDQLTKIIVKQYLGPFNAVRVLPFFNIIYVENTGSAFGLFKELGSSFFIIISLIVIAIVILFILKEKNNKLGYALILGGAVGNLLDRIQYGYVIDFLEFHVGGYYWPIFNIADSALTIGVFILLYETFIVQKQKSNR